MLKVCKTLAVNYGPHHPTKASFYMKVTALGKQFVHTFRCRGSFGLQKAIVWIKASRNSCLVNVCVDLTQA